MASSTVSIVFRLTEFAVRNFNRIDAAIDRAARSAEQGTSSLERFNRVMTASGVASGVGLAIAAKNAASLEDAMARLETVTRSSSQTVSQSLANAEAAARTFSTQFSASAKENIRAQFEIATAGVAVEEQIVATQGAFKLAQATVGDFTQTAQLLGQFLNTFGKNAELGYLDPMTKIERITDVLSATVQRFQVTLPVLAEGFKFIIGPARQLNLQLEEVSVALGILNTAGFRGTLAGTALSNMFNKLDNAVQKLDLDPSSFQDLEGNLTNLADFLDAINVALKDSSPLEGQIKLIDVFDIRAGRVIKTLADNVDQLRKMTNELEIAKGATDAMAKTIETTTSASLKQFGNAIENISTSIGGVINDAFRPFLRIMSEAARTMAKMVEQFKVPITIMLLLGTALLTAKAAMFVFGVVTTATSKIVTIFASFVRLANLAIIEQAVQTIVASVMMGQYSVAAVAAGVATRALAAAIIEVLVLSVVLGVIAAAIYAIYAITKATWDWFNANEALGTSLDQEQKQLRAIQAEYVNTASKARMLAAEFDRLGKAQRLGSKAPIARGDVLGTSALAVEAAKLFGDKELNLTLDQAIKKALENIGEGKALEDVAQRLVGSQGAKALAEAFQNVINDITDIAPTTSQGKLKDYFAKGNEAIKSFAVATEISIRAVIGDTEEAVTAFSRLTDSVRRISESPGDRVIFNKETFQFQAVEELNKFIVDVIKNMNILGDVPEFTKIISGMRDLGIHAGLSDEAIAGLVKTGSDGTTAFGQLVEQLRIRIKDLGNDIDQSSFKVIRLVNAYELYKGVLLKIRTGSQRLENETKKLNEGLTSTPVAIAKIDKLVAGLRNEYDNLTKAQKLLDQEMVNVKNAFDTGALSATELVKKLGDIEKESQPIDGRLIELSVTLRDADIQKQIYSSFFNLTGVDLGSAIGKNIRSTSQEIQSSITQAITGGITSADAAVQIRNALREQFAGRIATQIGDLFASNFLGGAQDKMTQFDLATVLNVQGLKGQFDALLGSGNLGGALDLAAKAGADLFKNMSGMSIGLEKAVDKATKLEEQINKINVATLTANSTDASFFQDLTNILRQPTETIDQIERQRARLAEFIQRANTEGASGPQREAETALNESLNRTADAASNITSSIDFAAKAADESTRNFGSTIRDAFQNITSATASLASTLSPVFDSFLRGAEILQNTSRISDNIASAAQVNLEFTGGESTFNITVNSTGGTGTGVGLEEGEIKDLLSQLEDKMRLENDRKLRELESRLRANR